MPAIIERKEAKALGLNKYFTGRECSRGHIAERYTICGKCTACQEIYLETYRKKNRDTYLKRLKDYHQRNRGRVLERQRNYYKENQEYMRLRTRKYFLENPEVKRDHERKRRLEKKLGGSAAHQKFNEEEALKAQKNRCANCLVRVGNGGEKYHVDHIMPLSRGGTNDKTNLQILCVSCNLRKSAKDPLEWAAENGRLF